MITVGIPTRNRAELAVGAVRSVLDSGVPDVAVVVSDNSTEAEERKRLEDFCAGQAGVEYVRPPSPMPMPDHWEWLRRTIDERLAPDHIAYLTDRMVFAAGALEEIASIVRAHPLHVVSYHSDHVDDVAAPVELVQTPWTGQLLELDSRRVLELVSRGRFGDHVPRMLNCVVPRGVLGEIEEAFGDVFGQVSPDYRFAFRCLALLDSFLYLDRPCLIELGMTRSAGINYLRGKMNEDASRFAAELSVERFGATPEPRFETIANAIFQEYCAVRAEAANGRLPPVDWRSYLATNAVSADRIRDPAWRERTARLLREHGYGRRHGAVRALGTAARMAAYLLGHPEALARAVRRQLVERPPGSAAASLLARIGVDPPVRAEHTFESTAAAVAHANEDPRPPSRHAWHVHELARAGAVAARLRRSARWN